MRSSGILTPISALPSRYGIGTVGKEAYDFVDFLKHCKQRYWQILPIGPTGYGDSPYQSFSARAGNPYWIDLDLLVSDGLLSHGEIKESGFVENPDFIDYGDLYEKRFELLRKAALRIGQDYGEFVSFRVENADWLDDYALFMSLKSEYGMASFHSWPDKYRVHNDRAIDKVREKLSGEIHFWGALQYLFYKQWRSFKAYAGENGVKIVGDIPIYVSPDSSDIWANPELFQVNGSREITFVAGCPPDYFNETGQRWGNPLYRWRYHKKQGYDWWIKRLMHAGEIFDAVRIDHFRGFSGYYSIPAENETAEYGEWKKGPGRDFISTIKEKIPDINVIAEDLGVLTPDVKKLLGYSGFPGMKVLQFAFDRSEDSDYLPHKYQENSVVYTGTHDNTTTADWTLTAAPEEVEFARRYLKIGEKANLTHALIRAAMYSRSDICVIPIQDWLTLGKEARINTPGTTEGNWRFRVRKRQLSEKLIEKILSVTEDSGRANAL